MPWLAANCRTAGTPTISGHCLLRIVSHRKYPWNDPASGDRIHLYVCCYFPELSRQPLSLQKVSLLLSASSSWRRQPGEDMCCWMDLVESVIGMSRRKGGRERRRTIMLVMDAYTVLQVLLYLCHSVWNLVSSALVFSVCRCVILESEKEGFYEYNNCKVLISLCKITWLIQPININFYK